MFNCPTNLTFYRLFPNIGFKIITETSSLEDSPCLERDKLSNRHLQHDRFRWNGNNYRQLLSRPSALAGDLASVIYIDHPAKHDERPSGETDMPQVNQPVEGDKHYGRQIPEIEPEKIKPETGSSRQRQPEEKSGRSRQVGRPQKTVAVRPRRSLLPQKTGETVSPASSGQFHPARLFAGRP